MSDMLREEAARAGLELVVPLYIFDGKYVVIGLQPYAAFQEVMERLEADNVKSEHA